MKLIGIVSSVLAAVTLSSAACYPTTCDPRTDPTKCECPPGTCGDYPSREPPITQTVRDAGRDAR